MLKRKSTRPLAHAGVALIIHLVNSEISKYIILTSVAVQYTSSCFAFYPSFINLSEISIQFKCFFLNFYLLQCLQDGQDDEAEKGEKVTDSQQSTSIHHFILQFGIQSVKKCK